MYKLTKESTSLHDNCKKKKSFLVKEKDNISGLKVRIVPSVTQYSTIRS